MRGNVRQLMESIIDVGSGLLLATIIQLFVFPLFGFYPNVLDSFRLLLYLLAYLFLDLGFGELFLKKIGKDKMRDNEMRRIIEEQINAIFILEQQMEDIKKQMQILQELIKEMKPNE
jgi:hypothetical protein